MKFKYCNFVPSNFDNDEKLKNMTGQYISNVGVLKEVKHFKNDNVDGNIVLIESNLIDFIKHWFWCKKKDRIIKLINVS